MQLSDFTSRNWKELTEWEWSYLRLRGVCNGCGSKGDGFGNVFIRWIIKVILKRLRLIFIEASCDIHDFTYWQGGDEKRRLECDLGFFSVIMDDIRKAELGFLSVLKYTILALCFYYAVRIGGKSHFIYH